LDSSQSLARVVSRRLADHLVDVVLQLGDLALRLDRDGTLDRSPLVTGGHLGDGAHLGGQR
jgi:hypothetical protein